MIMWPYLLQQVFIFNKTKRINDTLTSFLFVFFWIATDYFFGVLLLCHNSPCLTRQLNHFLSLFIYILVFYLHSRIQNCLFWGRSLWSNKISPIEMPFRPTCTKNHLLCLLMLTWWCKHICIVIKAEWHTHDDIYWPAS